MRNILSITILLLGLFLIPVRGDGQEETPEINVEQSAEVFLEEYSDEFQERFFEALKQKGIENYDRAINLLLECKRLDPDKSTVDHELAKAYLGNKQYIPAQEFAIEAIVAEPDNFWFLDTLVEILQKQGGSLENIASKIPFEDTGLKENLALIYFRQKDYEDALKIMKDLKTSNFKEDMTSKINDSVQMAKFDGSTVPKVVPKVGTGNEVGDFKEKMNQLMGANSFDQLEELSNEALEIYPSQPYFYYSQGYALNRKLNHTQAIKILETALDYLVDDVPLANHIYQELADAYSALGNNSMANMYLRKIIPRF